MLQKLALGLLGGTGIFAASVLAVIAWVSALFITLITFNLKFFLLALCIPPFGIVYGAWLWICALFLI